MSNAADELAKHLEFLRLVQVVFQPMVVGDVLDDANQAPSLPGPDEVGPVGGW